MIIPSLLSRDNYGTNLRVTLFIIWDVLYSSNNLMFKLHTTLWWNLQTSSWYLCCSSSDLKWISFHYWTPIIAPRQGVAAEDRNTGSRKEIQTQGQLKFAIFYLTFWSRNPTMNSISIWYIIALHCIALDWLCTPYIQDAQFGPSLPTQIVAQFNKKYDSHLKVKKKSFGKDKDKTDLF